MPQCPIYHTDTRRTIGVLQQWQALLAPTHTRATEVTLADMAALMASWQEAFGATTTLETMIQSLVAADLREQVARRRASAYDLACIA